MARGEAKPEARETNRRLIAGVVVFAFLLQSFALFAIGTRAAASSLSPSGFAAYAQHGLICGSHFAGGDQRNDVGGCPMCKTLGCATPGTPVIALAIAPGERLIGLLSVISTEIAPRTPPYNVARPRGPPAIV
jgi:hypothetical protein